MGQEKPPLMRPVFCNLQETGHLICDFKSVSLRRCETNKPPAMRVRIEGYTVITKTLQTSYNIGVQANCKTK